MAFNKGAIDVLIKGLDPKHPHKDIGPDGTFVVPSSVESVLEKKVQELKLDETLLAARRAFNEHLEKLEEEQSKATIATPTEEQTIIVPKKRGRPPTKK